jgi:hypothetical protein
VREGRNSEYERVKESLTHNTKSRVKRNKQNTNKQTNKPGLLCNLLEMHQRHRDVAGALAVGCVLAVIDVQAILPLPLCRRTSLFGVGICWTRVVSCGWWALVGCGFDFGGLVVRSLGCVLCCCVWAVGGWF